MKKGPAEDFGDAVKTQWRCGTALTTSLWSHWPNSTTRFWWQEGQKCRRLSRYQRDFRDSTRDSISTAKKEDQLQAA